MFPTLLLAGFVFLLWPGCEDPEAGRQPGAAETENVDSTAQVPAARVKRYYVQLAALSAEDKANEFQEGTGENLPAIVQPARLQDGTRLWRVVSGPFLTEPDATRRLAQARRAGFQDAFISIELAGPDPMEIDSTEMAIEEAVEESKLKQLTSIGGCSGPRWSPTGREIAFFRRGPEQEGLYAIGTGGGQHSRIVESGPDFEVTRHYRWSPDGRQMAVVVRELNRRFEKVENLYLFDKRGSRRRAIMQQLRNEFAITNLLWAPDGTKLAFEADYAVIDPGAEDMASVLVIDLDWDFSEPGSASRPRWIRASNFGRTNRLLGFSSAQTLLFLSEVDTRTAPHDDMTFQVWSYDLPARQPALLSGEQQISNCSAPVLGNGFIVCSTFAHQYSQHPDQIVLQDLTGNDRQILLGRESATDTFSDVQILGNSDIFFTYNDKLLVYDSNGRKAMMELQAHPQSLTVSPSGRKVCFEIGGDLYSLRLAF